MPPSLGYFLLQAGNTEHARDLGGKGSDCHKAAVIGDTVSTDLALEVGEKKGSNFIRSPAAQALTCLCVIALVVTQRGSVALLGASRLSREAGLIMG